MMWSSPLVFDRPVAWRCWYILNLQVLVPCPRSWSQILDNNTSVCLTYNILDLLAIFALGKLKLQLNVFAQRPQRETTTYSSSPFVSTQADTAASSTVFQTQARCHYLLIYKFTGWKSSYHIGQLVESSLCCTDRLTLYRLTPHQGKHHRVGSELPTATWALDTQTLRRYFRAYQYWHQSFIHHEW